MNAQICVNQDRGYPHLNSHLLLNLPDTASKFAILITNIHWHIHMFDIRLEPSWP